MIIDELNKKIADIESLATDKTSTIESKVSELQDGLLMVADAVDIIPEMVDEKITAITKEFSTIKDSVSKVKARKGDKGDRGEPGIDGIGIKGDKGDNGSPDTGEQIVSKLNELEGVLDTKVLKGFEMPDVNGLQTQINTIGNQTLRLLSRPTGNTSAISSVVTNATLTGSGTASSPLGVVGGSPIDDTQIAVRVATTAALAGSPVYANGSSGVGATLTRGTNGALPAQDGVALEIGDRILVKNQASTLQNGIYEVTSLGSASTKWVLTRTTDADSSQELDEMIVAASEGTTNRAISYGQQTNNPTIGTSAITFTAAPSVALSQATTGTQAINQIPLYTGTARQVTRGTSSFKYDPITNIFTINSGSLLFPTSNSSGFMTNDGSGVLSYTAGTTLTDGDKGDITVSGSGATWSVDTNAITFSKLQQLTTLTVFGNSTAGTANATAVPFSTISPIQKGTNTNNIYSAGLTSTGQGGSNSIIFGASAGSSVTSASVIALGQSAASGATGTMTNTVSIGQSAMSGSTGANSFSISIGRLSGANITTNAQYGIFIGDNSGNGAINANNAIFLGQNAGYQATGANNAISIGNASGYQNSAAVAGVFIGYGSGATATSASYANMIGRLAGNAAANAQYSNFFGFQAGYNATNAANSIFIGKNAGYSDTVNNVGSGSSILIGESSSTGGYKDSIAIGKLATNTATNELMIGSASSPINTMVVKGTGGIQVPVGTTAERVAVQGMIRYNTTTSKFEGYDGSTWVDLN